MRVEIFAVLFFSATEGAHEVVWGTVFFAGEDFVDSVAVELHVGGVEGFGQAVGEKQERLAAAECECVGGIRRVRKNPERGRAAHFHVGNVIG